VAVVVDSGLLVAFLDGSDSMHAAADRAIRKIIPTQPLVASIISYAELLTGARLGHHDEGRITGLFDELISTLVPVDRGLADSAAALRAANPALRMPDALIAATAETQPEVSLLLTGDRRLARLKDFECRAELVSA
jgi:predicted nucleic acid-binding protein